MITERNNYVDFHCHSAIKPYGKSFNYKKTGVNNSNRGRSSSIWRYDPPSLGDKLLNYVINLTKFSQANFTSLSKGGVAVVCESLYPIEKYFFENKIKSELIKDITANFATGLGRNRVDMVQEMTNYFEDLEREYDFYKQLNNVIVGLPEGRFRYRIVRSYAEIDAVMEIAKKERNKITTICVIMSIEGLHVLNDSIDQPPNETSFLKNLQAIKNWEAPPFFVTVAHHFWNHICGHAESFTKLVKSKVDQSEGLNLGFTAMGIKIVHALLSTENGKRILIDVKHMSVASRTEYYALLDQNADYKNIPIIASHAAANGMRSFEDTTQSGSKVANQLKAVAINFYNAELIRIAKSKGILGLQLDERRVASEATLKATKHSLSRSKIMHYRSELLWNQIQHIAEVLDSEQLFAWDCIVIGSDFDGIIDPLNSFWTAEELPFLADFLERHAYNYLKDAKFKFEANTIQADEVIARVMSKNGMAFLKTNFV